MSENKKTGSIKEAWNEAPWYIKLIILVVAAIIVFVLVRNVVVWYKKYQAEQILMKATASGTLNGVPYSVNYGTAAQTIYNALYNNDWFGWTEDEEAAIIAVNNVPKPFVPALSTVYFNLYKKNLQGDLSKYLSSSDYSRVANQFN